MTNYTKILSPFSFKIFVVQRKWAEKASSAKVLLIPREIAFSLFSMCSEPQQTHDD